MSEVSQAAKAKARELLPQPLVLSTPEQASLAFARFIQQVSDAAGIAIEIAGGSTCQRALADHLAPFILPEPVDPLVQLEADILADQARQIEALTVENARLRNHISATANSINIVGSPYDQAVTALDAIVAQIKREARATLEETSRG